MERLSGLFAEFVWLAPVVFLGGGIIAGLIFERVLAGRIRAAAARTAWKGDDILVESLHGASVLWLFLLGVYLALQSVPLPPRPELLARRLLLILFLVSLTLFLARVAANLITIYSSKNESVLPSTSIIRNLTKLVVWVLGMLVVLQTLGIAITPVLTALGVGGLAIALALQDTLSNLFGGVHILASRQVQVGDFIRIDSGEEGYVRDIRWRNTVIQQLANNMVIVPNAKLASAVTVNFNQPDSEMGISVNVGVSYTSDLEHVERVALEIARDVLATVPGAVRGAEPSVRFHTFADSSIHCSVNLRAQHFADQFLVKHEFIKRLHKRFAAEGIEIPNPVRTILLKREEGAAS